MNARDKFLESHTEAHTGVHSGSRASNGSAAGGDDAFSVSRRRFFKKSGALAIAFSLAPSLIEAQQAARPVLPGSLNRFRKLDSWLSINADGTLTIFSGKVELGQGITTALTQIVADELDIEMARIKVVSGDTARVPDEGVTAGSLSIEHSGAALRFAAAEARALLLAAAAQKLGAPVDSLQVIDGTITAGPVTAGGARATYWELAGSVPLAREATPGVKAKTAAQHRLTGKNVPRRDIPAKVTGGEAFVQDMRLPGMLFGRVVRPPSLTAKLLSVDEAAARRMPGVVTVLRDGNFLAVTATREEQVIAARHALTQSAKWEVPAAMPPKGAALYAHMKTMRSNDSIVGRRDNPEAAASATRTLKAEYTKPFQAHGSIGPSCAVAQWDGAKVTVWTHSQSVFQLRGDMVKVLKVPEESINCIHKEGAGCYGHNGADDVALDAALVARAAKGRPVKLQWMREDEFGWEPYGSAMVMNLSAGLDANGRIVDWTHELWSHTHSTRPYDPDGNNLLAGWHLASPVPMGPAKNIPQPNGGSDRNAVPYYVFAQTKTINHLLMDMPLRVSALRTLGAYGNVFAAESFMDELAALAGADPVDFRLRHLTDPRARAVLEKVAADANWKTGDKNRGVAFSRYKNNSCYVAAIADIEVDRASGMVSVPRIALSVEAGLVVSPDGIVNQIEGGAIQSASWTLREQIAYDERQVLTKSWADYPIFTYAEVPKVKVSLINLTGERSLGVGEGSQGPVVAAIANAFARATGKRLRDLPFTPDKVKAALA